MLEIAIIQKARVLTLLNKERESKKRVFGLNTAINDYKNLLLSIQKIKFDLGLDEFKRGIPGARENTTSVIMPDGTNHGGEGL